MKIFISLMIISTLGAVISCRSTQSVSKFSVPECNKHTTYEQLDCSMNNLELKENYLNRLGNQKTSDYEVWNSKVIEICEGSNSAMGESISESLDCKHTMYDKRIATLEK